MEDEKSGFEQEFDTPPSTVEADELPQCYINLMSGMSPAVGEGKAGIGDIVATMGDTLTKLVIDDAPGFDAICIEKIRGRRRKDNGGLTQCQVWRGGEEKCKGCDYETKKGYGECEDQWAYFLRIVNGWPDEEGTPPPVAILTLGSGAGGPAARGLNTQIAKDGGYPFKSIMRFGKTQKISKKVNKPYSAWTVARIGETERPVMLECYEEYKQLKNVGVLLLPETTEGEEQGDTRPPF